MATVYDVCVVGAGVIGSSTARQLAKLGKKTILLEQFPLPHWRGSSHGQTRLIRCIDSKPHIVKMAYDSLKMWKEIEEQAGETIMIQNVGLLVVEAPSASSIKTEEEILRKNNVDYQLMNSRKLKERFPELSYGPGYQGIHEKTAGILMADKCLRHIQKQFVGYGGTLCDGTKVVSIEPDGNGVTIVTNKTSYICRKVILTAGPWINNVLKPLGLQLDVKTVQAPVYYWKIKKSGCYNVGTFPCYFDASTNGNRKFYGIPSFEYPGLFKFGPSGEQLSVNSVPVDPDMRDCKTDSVDFIKTSMVEYLKAHMPYIDASGPAIVEMCMYTMSFDRNFIIDRHPDLNNVIIASGFSGQGFKHAPVVGKILSELALDQTPSYDISHFKIQRFLKPIPSSL